MEVGVLTGEISADQHRHLGVDVFDGSGVDHGSTPLFWLPSGQLYQRPPVRLSRTDTCLPTRGQRPTLFVSGGRLNPDHRILMELVDRVRSGIGAGAPHARHDLIKDVFDPGTMGIEVHPRGRNAFLEEFLSARSNSESIRVRSWTARCEAIP